MILKTNKRVIITSDIHGDYKILAKLLEKVNFSKKDILIINGDTIERSNTNLKTLDYLMDLKNKYEVYITKGNCDEVLENLEYISKEKFLFFALERQNSIINEMADILNIKIDENINKDELVILFKKHFINYFNFVSTYLDHIILNDKYYINHKGNTENVLNNFKLLNNNYINIAGHKPTILFRDTIPNFNIFKYDDNNLFIDGSYNVSQFGQLNYLIYNDFKLSYDYITNFNIIKAKASYDYNILNPQTINNKLSSLELIDYNNDYYTFKYNGNILYSHKSEVNFNNCYLATNYFMPIEKDKVYEIALINQKFCIIRYNGIIGYIDYEVYCTCFLK